MHLSIVTSLYGSAPYLNEFFDRVTGAVEMVTDDYELILVNDGSPDDSLAIAVRLSVRNPRVKVIDLSRNFGQHKAIMTGLMHATGDYVFLVDCDLEEDPELLTLFYETLKNDTDADVAFGVQQNRKGSWWERVSGNVYYSLISALSSTRTPRNIVLARMMTKRYVSNLTSYRESELVLWGLCEWTGFKQIAVPIVKQAKGSTTYTWQRKIALAIRSITAFSDRPLLYISYTGVAVMLLSLALIMRTLILYTLGKPPSGYASLIISLWFLGGLTIFCIGIVAIYLSIIFVETKHRPYTIIRDVYSHGSPREPRVLLQHVAQSNVAPTPKDEMTHSTI